MTNDSFEHMKGKEQIEADKKFYKEQKIYLKDYKYVKSVKKLIKSELKIKIDENVKYIKDKKEAFELYAKTFDKDEKPKRKIEVEKILEINKLLKIWEDIDPVHLQEEDE